jgi:23S rRNA (cytidine1920-2'-O)/16S rRNA (cytidine1409-2'-O)-methyltransferase
MPQRARLDVELARRGLARSRAHAAQLIAAGAVRVDGATARKASTPVVGDARIELDDDGWVSRAAHKLLAALDAWPIDLTGRLVLDLGASTGGFTQVALARGAREVVALDVGHGQLVDELRRDERVRVVEGENARDLTPGRLAAVAGTAEAPSAVVGDLSFISLRLVLPAIAAVAAPDADLVLLVKPQFEVGRVRDGVVRDAALRAEALRGVLATADEVGLRAHGILCSPIRGGEGNVEYLLHLRADGGRHPTEWETTIATLGRDADPRATESPR